MNAEPDKASPRPWRAQALPVAVLVAGAAAAALFFVLANRHGPWRTDASGRGGQAGPVLAPLCDKPMGSGDAKVQVIALLPITTGCQDDLGLYLADAAGRYGTMLALRIHDMKGPTAKAIMEKHGIRCACVLVNQKTRFDFGADGGKVLLEGPIDLLDVRHVLAAELKTAYGSAAPELPPPPADADVPKRRL